MAQNKKSARVAVYMSDGFPLIVFDERLPGGNSFKGVRFNGQQFARVEVAESSLDGLKKQRFPATSKDLFPQQDFSEFQLRSPRQNKLPPTLFRDDTSSTSKKDD